VGFYIQERRAERDLLSTHDEEEKVDSFEGLDLDVFVQERSSEFDHPEGDEAEVPERRSIRLLADYEEDFPRDVEAKRGGAEASLQEGRRERREKETDRKGRKGELESSTPLLLLLLQDGRAHQ